MENETVIEIPLNEDDQIEIPLDDDDQIESNSISDMDGQSDANSNDYYDIESDTEDLPSYSIANKNIDLLPEDRTNGWLYEEFDNNSMCGPFLSTSSCTVNESENPEAFFNSLFDDRMWTIISDATNTYARQKSGNTHGKNQ